MIYKAFVVAIYPSAVTIDGMTYAIYNYQEIADDEVGMDVPWQWLTIGALLYINK